MSFSLSITLAQNLEPNFHGYIQSRFISDFVKTNNFMIRRAKVWIDGKVPDMDMITYKIQGVYRSFKDNAFIFQDAFADIKFNDLGYLRAGRFVPDFLLQRTQRDYAIPFMERAAVINGLVHSPQSMARQIGIQYTFQPQEIPIHLSAGIFNANITSPGKNIDKNFLYTLHSQFNLKNNNDLLISTGFSLSYRYVNSLSMSSIYNSNSKITGNDYRFGFELQLQYKALSFQSEYVQANINKDRAWGYYAGTDIIIVDKFHANASVEKYQDLNQETNDNEWYSLGLNYCFTKNTRIMTDFKTQFSSIENNYLAEVQFQVFFN